MSKENIHAALALALAEIHRLKKDDKNQHGGYKYVSVDDVKDHVRPILAKHGLTVSVSEASFELVPIAKEKGTTMSALIAYEVTIWHVSGQKLPGDRITICLPYTGAQTAGAARSYAVKEWMKGTLLVSTGEKDAIEGGADADAYKQQAYDAPHDAPPQRKTANAARKDGTDEEFKKIQKGLRQIEAEGTIEDLVAYWKGSGVQQALKTMPQGWFSELTKMKDELKAKFDAAHRKPLNAPSTGEHDPETGEVFDPATDEMGEQ